MKYRILLTYTLSLIISQKIFAQDSLTIEQVVQQTLRNHPAIVQAEHRTEATEARALESETAKLPTASVQASYTRLEPASGIAFPGLGDFNLYPLNNYDVHIGGEYTIYDFGKADATISASRSNVQTAQDAVELTKTDLAYNAIHTFYTILFLQQSIQVANDQIDALNQHLTITNEKVTTGTATNFDVLTTQVRVGAAQDRKVELESALHQQQTLLHQLLGVPDGKDIPLRGDFAMTSVALNVDSLTEQAFLHRTELKAAKDAEQSAELQYKMSSFGNSPSLKVDALYGFKNGFFPDIDVLRGNLVASLSLQVPVFDGGRTSHQEEETHADMLAEQAHIKNIERQIRADVERSADDIKTALDKYQIANVQVQQATDAVTIARKLFETGSVTNIDLLDAETAEAEAKLARLRVLFTYVMGQYELKQSIGSAWF
ncbi:MAG TPA: TolC family protein [Candidatus Kapabacteria bacterium]|nr:TolC family protein [Candidatus Kapabacteria bacterium]